MLDYIILYFGNPDLIINLDPIIFLFFTIKQTVLKLQTIQPLSLSLLPPPPPPPILTTTIHKI